MQTMNITSLSPGKEYFKKIVLSVTCRVGRTRSHSSALSALLPSKAPLNQTSWFTPVLPAHRRLRQEGHCEFGAKLFYIMSSVSVNTISRSYLNKSLIEPYNNFLAILVMVRILLKKKKEHFINLKSLFKSIL